jgi:formylglycine-generating enzyme required for sulfatase activity
MNQLRLVLVLFFAGIGIINSTSTRADESLPQSAHKLKLAIEDLIETHGSGYPEGPQYLKRLNALLPVLTPNSHQAREKLEALRREALLANPEFLKLPGILVVQRKPKDPRSPGVMTAQDEKIGFSGGLARDIAMPSNHECNASLERTGYDDRIAMLDPGAPEVALKTIYRPDHGAYVGQLDLDFDARHLLFTQSDETNWKLFEWDLAHARLRQVSQMPDDVDCMDGAYMPNGDIVFGSTASYQSVPCWHGQKRVSNLYVMKRDGSRVRQVCFDQDHDFHPTTLNNGQVLYQRWDYTGICHIFLRQLMVMNPDGTKQRAIYGSNSWYPNSLYFPQALPGESNKIISILSGYHGAHRAGQLVLLDTSVGWHEASGIVQRISGKGDPITPKIKDDLVKGDWPLFLHPYALTNKHFLVSAKRNARSDWAIYLTDIFDNLVLLREEPGYALLESTPIVHRKRPPVIPEQIDLVSDTATVFIQDVYAGPGLQGVPRGTAKRLRLLAYHFGYRGLAGSDKVGYGGPWEAMQILGTVPLERDGSASFKIPSNTPVAVQVLDHEDKAIQLMRSWFTAMPGEHVSCEGCHEAPNEAVGSKPVLAANKEPRALTPWYGPARGFDFEREVQPVLNTYCVSCHDGSTVGVADLRSESNGAKAEPKPIGYVPRLHPDMLEATQGKLKYSPAYDVLIHYIRRVGIEDDVSLLTPGEYHANTSELIQMLEKGHHGVELDAEALSRLITWIDLNGPCHGTWGDVFPIPDGAHERRMALRKLYGGPMHDPEKIYETSSRQVEAVPASVTSRPAPYKAKGGAVSLQDERKPQNVFAPERRQIDLGGVKVSLVRVPAGEFVMGNVHGQADEFAQRVVTMDTPFWMSECEVTNAQFRQFDPSHDSGYYSKRRDRADGKGLSLNGDEQPAVRLTWEEAMDFCHWLSKRSGLTVTLPTEQQWEYTCRAGSVTPLNYGGIDEDFSVWANMADLSFSTGLAIHRGRMMPEGGVTQATGGVPHLVLEGAKLADLRFDDHHRVTANVGSYKPNHWGLYDMHGNATEWTLSEYDHNRKVVRGGSFFDRPTRSRSSFRWGYPSWQRVFNVGFRIVVMDEHISTQVAKGDKH